MKTGLGRGRSTPALDEFPTTRLVISGIEAALFSPTGPARGVLEAGGGVALGGLSGEDNFGACASGRGLFVAFLLNIVVPGAAVTSEDRWAPEALALGPVALVRLALD